MGSESNSGQPFRVSLEDQGIKRSKPKKVSTIKVDEASIRAWRNASPAVRAVVAKNFTKAEIAAMNRAAGVQGQIQAAKANVAQKPKAPTAKKTSPAKQPKTFAPDPTIPEPKATSARMAKAMSAPRMSDADYEKATKAYKANKARISAAEKADAETRRKAKVQREGGKKRGRPRTATPKPSKREEKKLAAALDQKAHEDALRLRVGDKQFGLHTPADKDSMRSPKDFYSGNPYYRGDSRPGRPKQHGSIAESFKLLAGRLDRAGNDRYHFNLFFHNMEAMAQRVYQDLLRVTPPEMRDSWVYNKTRTGDGLEITLYNNHIAFPYKLYGTATHRVWPEKRVDYPIVPGRAGDFDTPAQRRAYIKDVQSGKVRRYEKSGEDSSSGKKQKLNFLENPETAATAAQYLREYQNTKHMGKAAADYFKQRMDALKAEYRRRYEYEEDSDEGTGPGRQTQYFLKLGGQWIDGKGGKAAFAPYQTSEYLRSRAHDFQVSGSGVQVSFTTSTGGKVSFVRKTKKKQSNKRGEVYIPYVEHHYGVRPDMKLYNTWRAWTSGKKFRQLRQDKHSIQIDQIMKNFTDMASQMNKQFNANPVDMQVRV